MSAIVGVYNLDGRTVERSTVEQMVTVLAHRGPDGAGVWSEGAVGLGHRMLWTTPESLHEELPLVDKSRDLTITADARIDNREELMEQLGITALTHGEVSDSQLILAAYGKWGEDCPQHLLGDFAFAIWDGREQKLFCARDHMGVKAFYYHHAPGKFFAFASEIKGLMCVPGVPRRLNDNSIGEHLASFCGDSIHTFFEEILRLPPAHTLTFSKSKEAQLKRYWALDPSRELRLNSDEEYAEKFREIFTEAVRCRMRSAFPVGSMLSGGLDSSSITCVARDLLAQDTSKEESERILPTFTAFFEKHKQCDERRYINQTIAQGGLEPHFFNAEEFSPLSDIDKILWHVEELFSAGNTHITWRASSLAQKRGVRVLLDGYDGDTTVSHGTGLFYELARSGRWITLARELKGYTDKVTKQPFKKAFWAWVLRYGIMPKVEKLKTHKFLGKLVRSSRKSARKLPQSLGEQLPASRPAWGTFINPDFVRNTNLAQRQKDSVWGAPKTEREDHHHQLTWTKTPLTLEWGSRMEAMFSIETRYPFWDKRLVEFCLSLPAEQKLHQGYIRMVMRRAMTGILPPAVQWRSDKSNLYPAWQDGLLTYERDRLEEVVLRNSQSIEKYFDVEALRRAYDRYISGQAIPADVVALCKSVVLSRWLQHTGLTS